MTRFDPSAAALPGSGIFGLASEPQESAVHVIPVPFDATASYRKGAWRGPEAVLRASRQVDLFDLLTGRPYEAGICLLETDERLLEHGREASALADQVIAAGGDLSGDPRLAKALARVNAIGAEINAIVHASAGAVLDQGKLPAVLGGDHSTPF